MQTQTPATASRRGPVVRCSTRLGSNTACKCCLLLLILLTAPGCEMGRSWFSMSSDSPMPWFGFDLTFPRPRRTSQVVPLEQDPESKANRPTRRPVSNRGQADKSFSKELHLPTIPAFFDNESVEELSFTGPQGTFSH